MADLTKIYTDTANGVFELSDGTYFLSDNTPIKDYDPNTGAYQETDGTWYTFDGFPLMSYDKNTGNYQEMDGTTYDKNGNPINVAKGVVVKTSVHTKTPAAAKSGTNTVLIVIGVVALIVIGVTGFIILKNKDK